MKIPYKNKLRILYNILWNLFFRSNNLCRFLLNLRTSNSIYIGTNTSLRNCHFTITGGGNTIVIGNECHLNGVSFYMESGNNKIIISDHVIINSSPQQRSRLNACGGCIIKIGEGSLLSNNIEIHTTDYHKILEKSGNIENSPSNVLIGNHVWIGLQCLILKGTIIANNCVVGARSLLTKEFLQENSIIAGHPAKVIKRNIDWEK